MNSTRMRRLQLNIAIMLLLVSGVYLFLSTMITSLPQFEPSIDKKGIHLSMSRGYSMSTINSCEYSVTYQRMLSPDEKLNVGSIYTYRKGDSHIQHRLIAIEGDKYIFQGDNPYTNKYADDPVYREDIIAQYLGFYAKVIDYTKGIDECYVKIPRQDWDEISKLPNQTREVLE